MLLECNLVFLTSLYTSLFSVPSQVAIVVKKFTQVFMPSSTSGSGEHHSKHDLPRHIRHSSQDMLFMEVCQHTH